MSDPIELLVHGRMPDPDGPGMLKVPTRSAVIADTLQGSEEILVANLEFGKRLVLVADARTQAALGARVATALRSRFEVETLVLPGEPHPDMDTVARVKADAGHADALLAVGSGTINDIVKYAAAQLGLPYAVFGTAPSMNGYTSVNAAITDKGHKKSLPARAPVGVFLDLGVLAKAPVRLIRAGLGDSLCRPTAQCDWLLAHLLFDQPYREAPFRLLAEDEKILFARAAGLVEGDREAIGALARTLVLSGFGMTICGGSYPASQGEHLISHYIDMRAQGLPPSYHGEQIGVTTLTMARLQAATLGGPAPKLAAAQPSRADLLKQFGPEAGMECWEEFKHKALDAAATERANARLARDWPQMRERLGRVTLPADTLEAALEATGAPRAARDLGWPDALYKEAVRNARLIRRRFTFLDLAAGAGRLGEAA